MTQGRRNGIVTAGTWCVDRNRMIEFWPKEDGLVEILSEERRGGGSGSNLAIDIRKLDPALPVETIGLIGDDDDGRFLLAEADAHGIDCRQLVMSRQERTSFSDAYGSKATGRRTHIFATGTGALLNPDHFDLASTTGRILHLGLPGVHRIMDAPWQGDANGWVTVLRKARAAGLVTNLELASLPAERLVALVTPCLPLLDLLVVNDLEIGSLGGETTAVNGETDLAAVLRSAKAVLERGAMQAVVVHFPIGAIAVPREGEPVFQSSVAVPPSEVVAANGAGDAFAAGFLYGFHSGWSLHRSLVLAHATAAASLRALATTDSVESWQACLDLAERWGWRAGL